jgi:hypothetical protein
MAHLLGLPDPQALHLITTINRGMLAHTWEELQFRLDVLHVTQGAHTEVCWVYGKNFVSIK